MKRIIGLIAILGVLLSCSVFQEEDDTISVSKLSFSEAKKSLSLGQEVSLLLSVDPVDALKDHAIKYTSSKPDVVEIVSTSNNGLIVVGKKNGTAVITAEADKKSSFCDITITGDPVELNPYILINTPVIEIQKDNRKTLDVYLQGGTQEDKNNFVFTNKTSSIIDISSSANTVVITGLKKGVARIGVSHEKSDTEIDVLVFVLENEKAPVYITTSQNVVPITSLTTHQLYMDLVGGTEIEKNAFQYQVILGKDVIDVLGTNNVCCITPKTGGKAIINVTNTNALNEFQVIVDVAINPEMTSIEVTKELYMVKQNENFNIQASVVGVTNNSYDNYFSYEIEPLGIVDIVRTNTNFNVTTLSPGIATLRIMNSKVKYPKDVLIMVEENLGEVKPFITTTQTVIQTELGATAIPLQMSLIGGGEEDKNNFSWVVEDSAIIELLTQDGSVTYARSALEYTASYTTTALINPKQIGSTKIVLSHPKTSVSQTVIVNVYPKGTFSSSLVTLSSSSSLFKVITGSALPVTLTASSGSGDTIGQINWSVKDFTIASVTGTSLQGVLSGSSSGITDLIVTGDSLAFPFEGKVLVGTEQELQTKKILYVEKPYYTVQEGQSVYIPIESNNQLLDYSNNFSVSSSSPEIAQAQCIGKSLYVKSLTAGESILTIRNSEAENTIQIQIVVLSKEVSLEKPFTIQGVSFFGVVKGNTKTLTLSMPGASSVYTDITNWEIENSAIAQIVGNGIDCQVTGVSAGQTIVSVANPKAQNTKKVIVFCANTEAELLSMIVLSVSKRNYLLKPNATELITINTNCSEQDKKNITWSSSDVSVVSIEANYETCYIKAVGVGYAEITVSHPQALSQKIFISVSENEVGIKSIYGESIVEMLLQTNRILSVSALGFSDSEKANIVWSIENSTIASISGANGEKGYVFAKKPGQTFITVEQKELDVKKRILLYVAETEEELLSSYLLWTDTTYYKVQKGDVQNISLLYGSKGFPESERASIQWIANNTDAVEIVANGNKATVIAKQEGLYTITASHPLVKNQVTIQFAVIGNENTNEYRIMADSLVGLIPGGSKVLYAKLVDVNGNENVLYKGDFEYSVSPDTFIETIVSNEVCEISAKEVGNTYITVTHPLAKEEKRVLVYVVATEEELQNIYPLTTNQTSYLLPIGAEKIITIDTKDQLPLNIQKISWAVSGSSVVVEMISKTQAKITAKSEGETKLVVSHPSSPVPLTIHIGVIKTIAHNSVEIVTDSIIPILVGESKNTSLLTNISSENSSSIIWSVDNTNCELLGTIGSSNTIKGVQKGDSHITIQYGNTKRTIVVKVCDTQEEINQLRVFNLDNRQFNLGRGKTITLSPRWMMKKAAGVFSVTDTLQNSVVKSSIVNDAIVLEGLNEGIAVLDVAHSSSVEKITLFVEVFSSESGNTTINEKYIAIDKNSLYMDLQTYKTGYQIEAQFFNFSQSEMLASQWTSTNTDIASIYGNGKTATLYLNAVGETYLTLINPYSLNKIEIRIVVYDSLAQKKTLYPYIETPSSFITLNVGMETTIESILKNVTDVDVTLFSYAVDNPEILSLSGTGNIVTINPLKIGQALVTITHPKSVLSKRIVFNVTKEYVPLVFLSSIQNFISLKKGEYKNVKVTLENGDPLTLSSIQYVSENGKIASVTGSQNEVTVKGLAEGLTRIKVTHPACITPFYVTVMVSSATGSQPTYISTEVPVLTVSNGKSITSTVQLENGLESEGSLFTWENKTPQTISIVSSGNYVVAKGLVPGVGKIIVSHPSSLNKLELSVIVEEAKDDENIYITSEYKIIELKPQDTAKLVDVSLVGGLPADVNGFSWSLVSYESSIKFADGTNKPVIELISSANQSYIKPVNEGVATVRVTHPKTSFKYDIKVIVSLYKELNFTSASITINQNDSKEVTIQAPTGESVYYESSNSGVATATGTNSICIVTGNKAGTAIITAKTASGSTYDELVVKVNAVENAKVVYISIPSSLLTLPESGSSQSVTASLIGDGVTEADQSGITWSLNPTTQVSSNDVVSLLGVTGNTCSFTPKKAGETTVYIKHSKVTATTVKKLYIKVTPASYTFVLDSFVQLNTAETKTLTATINGTNVDYSKMTWSVQQTDTVVQKVSSLNNQCTVKGLKAGTAKIICSYQGMVKEVELQVLDQPYLSLPTNIVIPPSSSYTITYNHKPDNATISVQLDTNQYISSIKHDEAKNTITLYSAKEDGYTVLTLEDKVNNLKAIATVHTVYNFQLYASASQITIKPNIASQAFTVGYNPENCVLEYSLTNKTTGTVVESSASATKQYVVLTGTGNVRSVVVKAPKTGEYELTFGTKIDGATQKTITVPIYCYYVSYQDVSPVITLKNGATKTISEVLHLKQGSSVELDMKTAVLQNYPLMQYAFVSGNLTYSSSNIACVTNTDTGKVTVQNKLASSPYTTVKSSTYVGLLTIQYKVYTNMGYVTKNKSFLVYEDVVIP